MAHLTQKEFQQAIELLATDIGLQRLRDRFVRYNALVTRRKVASVDALANQLFVLSSGLRRQVPATYAFQAIWSERINAKLGEDGEKELEKLAESVNGCLGENDEILADKTAALDEALAEYARALSHVVGSDVARMDMLMKAVPSIAEKLRSAPPPATHASPPPESVVPPSATDPTGPVEPGEQ